MNQIPPQPSGSPSPNKGRWPLSLLAAIAVYAWAAFGAIPYTYWAAYSGNLHDSTVGELLASLYRSPGTLFGSLPAALGAWLLLKHSKHAVWAGVVVVAWVACKTAVLAVRPPNPDYLDVLLFSAVFPLVLFSFLLWLMLRWRTRGLLA
jgi:hypothetical protein